MPPDTFAPALFDAINILSRPPVLFTAIVAAFAAAILLRRHWVRPAAAGAIACASSALLAAGLTSAAFRAQALKPDNVAVFLLLGLTAFLLWAAFRQAVRGDEPGGGPEAAAQTGKVHTWPHLLYPELIAAVFVTAALCIWSLALDAPLEQPANPEESPNPAKAPWYFVGLQEMLVYFDPWLAGAVFPMLMVLGLMAIPYLDPNPDGAGTYTFRRRPFAVATFLFGFLVLWIGLIVVGAFVRGPNWYPFGIFEPWDDQKTLTLANLSLSDCLWKPVLGRAPPEWWLAREWPGILLVLAYFVVPPILVSRLFRDARQRMGTTRYCLTAFLVLAMLALPIAMYLRWVFGLKYFVSVPERLFNL